MKQLIAERFCRQPSWWSLLGLVIVNEPRWYEVKDRHGRVLESRLLPPGTDLRRALIAAILEHIDSGWNLGEFVARSGTFFCTRCTEWRMVSITPTAPGTP
jgi:hypothetical protein